ncbi:MAG: DMSO reductase [Sulfobacillus acidophilus]|uniref:DMSO reductase n=1 Tax=Sulfobacillus acidophilus TaxID=53633 RepID=A0A2T2WEI4_9FIRM|nr:MAG: DMSO reductase [Sulfobacillus acidophilus]
MKPAPQLLVLTLGQGLAGGMTASVGFLASIGGLNHRLALLLLGAALFCAILGGGASFFHMHHFSAARYILRRLKTSWLSREALTTGLFGGTLFLLTVATVWGRLALNSPLYIALAWLVTFFGLVAIFVTAMLYASIPAMLSWHSPVTVLNLLAVGLLGGSGWGGFFGMVEHGPSGQLAAAVAIFLVVTGAVKAFQWHVFSLARHRIRATTGFGLPFAPYRLQDSGTTRAPYRTQTQVHPVISDGLRLRMAVVTAIFLTVLPIVLVILSQIAAEWGWMLGAAISITLGSIFERWLFFADATHSSRVFFADEPREASRVAEPVMRGRLS